MSSRPPLPAAAELLELRRAGVAEVRTHIDGTFTLTLRPLRRRQHRARRGDAHEDAHLTKRRQPQQRQHEKADRLTSGQRRRRNIAARKAGAAVLLQRAARGFLGRAQLAALRANAAAAQEAAARRLQQRQRLRRELALLKQDACKPLTPQQWQLVEKKRRKSSPTPDAAASPAKRPAAASTQRCADGEESELARCMREAQAACVQAPAPAAAAGKPDKRNPAWRRIAREEAARRQARSS